MLKQRASELFLESTGRVALAAQPVLVRILRETFSGLENVLSLNGACELFVAYPHAGGHAGPDDDLGVDHPVEHVAAQSIIFLRVDAAGSEDRLELLATTRIGPLEVVVVDFHFADGRDRKAPAWSHVLMNTPERERNADENHDPPRDPSGGVVSNELEHEISLDGSRAIEPIGFDRGP